MKRNVKVRKVFKIPKLALSGASGVVWLTIRTVGLVLGWYPNGLDWNTKQTVRMSAYIMVQL